jgi:hypothetical protein
MLFWMNVAELHLCAGSAVPVGARADMATKCRRGSPALSNDHVGYAAKRVEMIHVDLVCLNFNPERILEVGDELETCERIQNAVGNQSGLIRNVAWILSRQELRGNKISNALFYIVFIQGSPV